MDTLAVLAQWGPHPGPHPGPHAPMGPAGGSGAGAGMLPWSVWGMGGGLVLTLLGLVLLAAVVVGVVYMLSARQIDRGDDSDALAVLRRRYAGGEIDDEEFERRRTKLEGPPS